MQALRHPPSLLVKKGLPPPRVLAARATALCGPVRSLRAAVGPVFTQKDVPTVARSVVTKAASVPIDSKDVVPADDGASSTFLQALFNVMNLLLGVGLLSIPFALKQAGWAGIGVLLVLGYITNYTGKVLVLSSSRASEMMAAEGGPAGEAAGYEDIAEAAFGSLGRKLISFVMYFELMGTCTLLMLLEGGNLGALLSGMQGMFWTGWPTKDFILLAFALIVPSMWLPSLSALSYLGICGLAATLTVTAVVGITLFTGAYTAGAATVAVNTATLPLTFGILAFVYAGHGVFPSIQRSMKQPQDFPKVLNVAYVIIAAVCTFLGGAGYYMYGAGAADVITYNLREGLAKQICSLMILVTPLAKFAITIEPVAAAATKKAQDAASGVSKPVMRLIARTALTVLCVVLARSIPFLAYFMSLVGAFMTIGVSIIFPVLCYDKLYRGELTTGRKYWNYVVLLVGLICAVSGTTAAVQSLMAASATVV